MAFDWLAKKLFGKAINDPTFGRIRFHPGHAPARSSWEGEIYFPPTGNKVTVIVCADDFGPTEIHREALRDLEVHWDSVKATIAPLAGGEFLRYSSGTSKLSRDVMSHLKLEYVEIGCHDEQEIYLEFWIRPASGSDESPTEHPLRVLLKNWNAVYARF